MNVQLGWNLISTVNILIFVRMIYYWDERRNQYHMVHSMEAEKLQNDFISSKN